MHSAAILTDQLREVRQAYEAQKSRALSFQEELKYQVGVTDGLQQDCQSLRDKVAAGNAAYERLQGEMAEHQVNSSTCCMKATILLYWRYRCFLAVLQGVAIMRQLESWILLFSCTSTLCTESAEVAFSTCEVSSDACHQRIHEPSLTRATSRHVYHLPALLLACIVRPDRVCTSMCVSNT
jgi:hypothetical protein